MERLHIKGPPDPEKGSAAAGVMTCNGTNEKALGGALLLSLNRDCSATAFDLARAYVARHYHLSTSLAGVVTALSGLGGRCS